MQHRNDGAGAGRLGRLAQLVRIRLGEDEHEGDGPLQGLADKRGVRCFET